MASKDNTTDFNALLDKPADSFERPKPLPEGEYVATIGKYEFGNAKNEKKTPKVTFTVQLNEPLPSVNAEDLALALGDKALSEKTMTLDQFLTQDSMWRLGQFLVDHVKVDAGIPTREQIEQTQGRQIIVSVKHNPGRTPDDPPFARIEGTAAVPEN